MIGSQGLHGQFPDPPASAVVTSADADFTPKDPNQYQDWMKFNIAEHLGADSEYEADHGYYIEVINPKLPRLPIGWEARAICETIGPVRIAGAECMINVTFPEVHDLVAAKAVVHRPQDIEFLQNVVDCGFVDESSLLKRIETTPVRKSEHENDKREATAAVRTAFLRKAPKSPKQTTFRKLAASAGFIHGDYEHVESIDDIVHIVSTGGHRKNVVPITQKVSYFVDTTKIESKSLPRNALETLEVLSAELKAPQATGILQSRHGKNQEHGR